ncbi:MAG: RNA methyltransferase [Bacteroidales bacterium]|jgi:tRNA (guanosine-2'-O-)-methyltransferase
MEKNNAGLIRLLEGFVTEKRKNLFSSVLRKRTRYITVVLEDIYQPQNASAVLRTCDCFGIQDVHIIENKNEYRLNPDVTLGSEKWLTLKRHNDKGQNSLTAVSALKKSGYRIIATMPEGNISLENFDLNKGKTALCFGTELTGLSGEIADASDEQLFIPMHGFTESFNISVSAAIILHHLTTKLRNSTIKWELTDEEILELKLNWLKKSVKNSEMIEKKHGSGGMI